MAASPNSPPAVTRPYDAVVAGLAAASFAGATQAQGFPLTAAAAGLAMMGPAMLLGRLSLPSAYVRTWRIAVSVFAIGVLVDVLIGGLTPLWALLAVMGVTLLGCLANRRTHRGVITCWILSTAMICLECLEAASPGILLFLLAWSVSSVRLFMKLSADRNRLGVAAAPVASSPEAIRPLRLLPATFMLAAIVFLVLPRSGGMEETWRAAARAQEKRAAMLRSGFSSQIDLTALTRIHAEEGIALRVRDLPAALRDDGLRLRIATLDTFTGQGWVHSGTGMNWEMRTLERDGSMYRLDLYEPGDSKRESQIELTIVPGEYSASGVALPEGTGAALLPVPRAITESDGSITLVDSTAAAPWKARIAPGPAPRTTITGAARAACLQRPEWKRPREIAALMDTILGEETDSSTRAARIRSWLRRTGQYTTKPGIQGSGVQAIEEFLFRAPLAGHCELYATAMALLAREAGIPSRIVTGYGGGEFDAASGDLLVRHQDAHAWTELYIEGQGWVPFDATPARPLSASGDRFLFSQTRGWISTGTKMIRDWLQGYDQQVQRQLVASSVGRLGDAIESLDSGLIPRTLSRLARNATEPAIISLAMLLLVLNALAYLILWFVRRAGMKKGGGARRPAGGQGYAPEILLELLGALGAAGAAPPGPRTPVELLRAAGASANLDPADTEGLAQLYSRWRFAGDDAAGIELRVWLRKRRSAGS